MTISEIWNQYLSIQKGIVPRQIAVFDDLQEVDERNTSLADQHQQVNLISIFNGKRTRNVDEIKLVSLNRLLRSQIDKNPKIKLFDVNEMGAWNCSLKLFSLYICLRWPARFIRGWLYHRSIWLGLFEVIKCFILKKNIHGLELYTSNGRLSEIYRLAFIDSGGEVFEYLHGICSEPLAIYYDILASLAAQKHANIYYINIYPGLPQPGAITKHLFKFCNREVFYENGGVWQNPIDKEPADVVVIGSGSVNHDYLASKLFFADLEAINICIDLDLAVVYCPHPQLDVEKLLKHLPEGVRVGKIEHYGLKAKLFLGSYSTVMFVAFLKGKNVLFHDLAWEFIPLYLQELFTSIDEYTLSKANIESWVESIKKTGGMGEGQRDISLAIDENNLLVSKLQNI